MSRHFERLGVSTNPCPQAERPATNFSGSRRRRGRGADRLAAASTRPGTRRQAKIRRTSDYSTAADGHGSPTVWLHNRTRDDVVPRAEPRLSEAFLDWRYISPDARLARLEAALRPLGKNR